MPSSRPGGTGWAGHGLAVLLNITEVRADAGDKPIHTVDQFVLDFRPVVLRGFKTSVELVLNSWGTFFVESLPIKWLPEGRFDFGRSGWVIDPPVPWIRVFVQGVVIVG